MVRRLHLTKILLGRGSNPAVGISKGDSGLQVAVAAAIAAANPRGLKASLLTFESLAIRGYLLG